MTFNTIVAFNIIVSFVIPLVALLMPLPMMWHKEHHWNFRVLQRVHLSTLVRFEVFMVVRMMMMFFWVLALCRLVSRFQHFGETYCQTVCFSETLESTDESTWRQNPEEHHHHHLFTRFHCPYGGFY
jgi:uncharacterized protein YqhQ